MNAPLIPISAKRIDWFSPPSLEDTDKACRVGIRIPTPSERDALGARCFELGLTAVSLETIRATQISELYKLDWTQHVDMIPRSVLAFSDLPPDLPADELDTWKNEAVADYFANLLDSFWLRDQASQNAANQWLEQEAERLKDTAAGAPDRPPEPMPASSVTPRERAFVRELTDFQTQHCQRYRMILATSMRWQQDNNALLFRLHLVALEPTHPEPSEEVPLLVADREGVLTLESADEIREYLGERAFNEIIDRADRYYRLSEAERKNSDSLPGKPSDPTGSPSPSGELEISGGKSTESPIGAAPTDGSEKTIDSSSATLSGNGATTEAMTSGPTAEAG